MCVACALTETELVTDVVAGGGVAVLVTVCVPAVAVADSVLLVTPAAALETAPVACPAALDAALLAAPDPQPLSAAVATPSASAATMSGRRAVDLIAVDLPVAGERSQWGAHASVAAPTPHPRGELRPSPLFIGSGSCAPAVARSPRIGGPSLQVVNVIEQVVEPGAYSRYDERYAVPSQVVYESRERLHPGRSTWAMPSASSTSQCAVVGALRTASRIRLMT